MTPALPESEEAVERSAHPHDEADRERDPEDRLLRRPDDVQAHERGDDNRADGDDGTQGVVALPRPLRGALHPEDRLEPAGAKEMLLRLGELETVDDAGKILA